LRARLRWRERSVRDILSSIPDTTKRYDDVERALPGRFIVGKIKRLTSHLREVTTPGG
jgi:hypothetical protein